MSLGDNIKRIRELRGLSVPDLAAKMGIGKAGIYKWEDGTTVPGTEKLTGIAEALGVSVNDLLTGNITSVQVEAAIPEKPPKGEIDYDKTIDGLIAMLRDDNQYFKKQNEQLQIDLKEAHEQYIKLVTIALTDSKK